VFQLVPLLCTLCHLSSSITCHSRHRIGFIARHLTSAKDLGSYILQSGQITLAPFLTDLLLLTFRFLLPDGLLETLLWAWSQRELRSFLLALLPAAFLTDCPFTYFDSHYLSPPIKHRQELSSHP